MVLFFEQPSIPLFPYAGAMQHELPPPEEKGSEYDTGMEISSWGRVRSIRLGHGGALTWSRLHKAASVLTKFIELYFFNKNHKKFTSSFSRMQDSFMPEFQM